MVLTLLIICFAGSAILGGVYLITSAPITAAQLAKVNTALSGVLPAFDNEPFEEAYDLEVDGQTVKMYPATLDGTPVGIAVEVITAKGFGGPIQVMVGFLPEGTIYNTALVLHSETPGLGDKLDPVKSDFSLQFKGKKPGNFKLAVKQDGGSVDAITAATISSRAFCDAVDLAYKAFKKIRFEEGGQS
ncbi:MAG: RnfABCDGE type electron transport complex subunit G [Bacteroidales bacterium]|nr:RnfABCDGE type electron transport complex subunit G [Bacteroidales bacterium]